jgi:hypothetical protein
VTDPLDATSAPHLPAQGRTGMGITGMGITTIEHSHDRAQLHSQETRPVGIAVASSGSDSLLFGRILSGRRLRWPGEGSISLE